ncbi:MAG: sensor histidine kinase [Lachnospiraceae bacterium]|nr:sensor histidine kinase [Lachnospiraceae bacterium]
MSTGKMHKVRQSGFGRNSVLGKVSLLYIVCGFVPMLLSILIFYLSMRSVLLEDAYEAVQEQSHTVQRNLERTLQPYQTLMEMLKNDKTLYIQLHMDYSRNSYVELAEYVDRTLESMLVQYTDLAGIHFYCENPTLPQDDYYFYQAEELNSSVRELLSGTAEQIILYTDPELPEVFYLASEMNYYSYPSESGYLVFEIGADLMESILAADSETAVFLLDSEGQIYAFEGTHQFDPGMTGIQELLPEWDTMERDTVLTLTDAEGGKEICFSEDAGMNLTLLMMKDQERILQNVRAVPLRLIAVMLVLMAVALTVVLIMSRNMNLRLKKLREGMKAIGSGRFDRKIEDLGRDEFGLMAAEVNQMGSQLNQLIEENYQKQLTIKNAEQNLLQEQINPHFLYNALAVISSLGMQERANRTVQSIHFLADFYRISLNKGRNVILVREEIALLTSYMKIQLLRFSDLVEIHYHISPEVEDYYTIKLLLQPLVENAIHHAREEETFLSIEVRAYEERQRVCFDVEDNGMGISPEELEKLQQELQRKEDGFGLKNVDNRIKLSYGEEYGVTVFSTVGEGTRIHLEIPVVRERK